MRFAGTQLSNFMGDTTDFSQIAGTASNGRRMERQAVMKGEGLVANAGVESLGKIQSAQYQADAIKAEGAAQGQASMMSGLASGIGSLAGGLGGLGGGGGGSSYGGYGSTGINTPGKYGSFDKASVQRAHNNFTLTPGLG